MQDAYMIRNDGKLFPVQIHYYFTENDVYRSIETGMWLLSSSRRPEVNDYFINLVCWYGKYFLNIGTENFIERFKSLLKDLHEPVEIEFIEENKDQFLKIYADIQDDFYKYYVPLDRILNQEFMRERIGGMYETNYDNKDCYFRISSIGFNWQPIIWDFVVNNQEFIDTVTIVRDESSTGQKEKYYSGASGVYKLMPVNDFITEKGNPVIESKKYLTSVRKLLLDGGMPFLDFRKLPMNPARAEREFDSFVMRENFMPRFWYKEDEAISRILDGDDVRKVLRQIT